MVARDIFILFFQCLFDGYYWNLARGFEVLASSKVTQ
jgi:hypothetical protein